MTRQMKPSATTPADVNTNRCLLGRTARSVGASADRKTSGWSTSALSAMPIAADTSTARATAER